MDYVCWIYEYILLRCVFASLKRLLKKCIKKKRSFPKNIFLTQKFLTQILALRATFRLWATDCWPLFLIYSLYLKCKLIIIKIQLNFLWCIMTSLLYKSTVTSHIFTTYDVRHSRFLLHFKILKNFLNFIFLALHKS